MLRHEKKLYHVTENYQKQNKNTKIKYILRINRQIQYATVTCRSTKLSSDIQYATVNHVMSGIL